MSFVKTLQNSSMFGFRRKGSNVPTVSSDTYTIPYGEYYDPAPKIPDAPADLVEQANLAIEKCRERLLAAAESDKNDLYNSTHRLLRRLETDGAFSDAQMKIFRTRLQEIDFEVRHVKTRIKLVKFITRVHEDEERAEEAEKFKAIQQLSIAQNQMMANQMGQIGAQQQHLDLLKQQIKQNHENQALQSKSLFGSIKQCKL